MAVGPRRFPAELVPSLDCSLACHMESRLLKIFFGSAFWD